jgi:hypothetical protein
VVRIVVSIAHPPSSANVRLKIVNLELVRGFVLETQSMLAS